MLGEGAAVSLRGPTSASARRGATIALAMLAGACWYPKERGDRLEQRLDQIEGERPADRSSDSAAIHAELKRVEANLADVQAKLQELASAKKPGAEPTARQTELTAEVGRLRASVEEYGRRLDAVERSVAQQGRASERTAERQGAPPAKSTRKAPPPSPAPAPQARAAPEAGTGAAGAGAAAAGGATGALALAREQEQRGQKDVARELYQQYADENPTEPGAAEAHFRLGELAYGERRYNDAILEFGRVARDFPRSAQAPDALLRTADSMTALGMKDDAATILAEIPQRYPSSSAAARAKKRLAEQR
jgi:tol-pal system protein YbgF